MAKGLHPDKILEICQDALDNAERLIADWFPVGKRQGNEYLTKNAKRGDQNLGSFSINLKNGKWADYADGNGASGHDLVHLHHWYFGTDSQSESARLIAQFLNKPIDGPVKKIKRQNQEDDWVNCTLNPPREAKDEDFINYYKNDGDTEWSTRTPVMRFPFHNEDESVAGWACRFEEVRSDGKIKKQVKYLTWCRNSKTGEEKYHYRHFAPQRPLQDLHLLAQNKKALVLITQGEKTNHYVNTHLFGKLVGTTSAGGDKAVDLTDWSPVIGRPKIFWPDNDESGFRAVLKVAEKEPNKALIKFYLPPMDKPKGWDVADAGEDMDANAIKKMLKDGMISYEEFSSINIKARFNPPVEESESNDLPPYDDFDGPAEEYDSIGVDYSAPNYSPDSAIDGKWRALGYDHGTYYYYSFLTGQLVALKPSQHDESNLLQFADLSWWESHYPGNKKPNYLSAKNFMMNECHRVGVFDFDKIRGCGSWIDDGRIVVHRGNTIQIDDKEIPVEEYKGKFIYERDITVQNNTSAPLTNAESIKLLDICKELNWERPINSYYLAGWLACSIIGGALPWRPHVFVTGPSGSGKTWVMKNIIYKILGREKIPMQGSSSSAGFRALAGSRSWPVWGDEIEAKTPQELAEFQKLLMVWRCASTDTDVGIVKSTVDGKVRNFIPRSCVCISAIGMNLNDYADLTRFSVLGLRKNNKNDSERREKFREFENKVAELLTEGYCSSFRARSQKLALTIRKNSKTFSRAVAELLGPRLGDQVGALLAGAYSLTSNNEIDLNLARSWVSSQDWTEYNEIGSDEKSCLSEILESHITFDKPKGGQIKRTVGELLILSRTNLRMANDYVDEDDEKIKPSFALSVLKRYGISRREEFIQISKSHKEIKNFLRNTQWQMNWGETLKRISGAQQKPSVRFSGVVHGAVEIPDTFLYEGGEEHEDKKVGDND